jgi:phosphoserine phosphatase
MKSSDDIKLACFDMDGVVFQHQNFWMELHKVYGTYEEGKRLTKKYLKSDYLRLVDEVVGKLWKGKPVESYLKLVDSAEYMTGAHELFTAMHTKGIHTALITSGPTHLAERAKEDLGIGHIYANKLVFRDGVVSGEFEWPLGEGTQEKIAIVKSLAKRLSITFDNIAYVGDHSNDVGVCREVGLPIAFNSEHEELNSVCKVVIKKKDLREILKYL